MNNHVDQWLEAYYDKTLGNRHTSQVENHLENCPACRQSLNELHLLSDWLAESPPSPDGLPTEIFVAQVMLRLPRAKASPQKTLVFHKIWRVMPFILFGLWVVFQASILLTALVNAVFQIGLDKGVFSSLLMGAPNASNLAYTPARPDNLFSFIQWALNVGSSGGTFGWAFILQFIILMIIGLLYWSWLASWWVRHNPSPLANQ